MAHEIPFAHGQGDPLFSSLRKEINLQLLCVDAYNLPFRVQLSMTKLPILSTEWTMLTLILQRIEPFHQTMHVQRVITFAPHGWTTISW